MDDFIFELVELRSYFISFVPAQTTNNAKNINESKSKIDFV